MLDAHLGKRRGPFALDLPFQARPGNTTVLVGESGAGKTTALRLLAGLERLDQGFARLDGEPYADAATGWHRPAWQRDGIAAHPLQQEPAGAERAMGGRRPRP